MKAYMSTGGRRRYKGKGDIFAGITPTRSTPELVTMAEREARAILAETEREQAANADAVYAGISRRFSPGLTLTLGCESKAALAESLAAFIAAPIPEVSE